MKTTTEKIYTVKTTVNGRYQQDAMTTSLENAETVKEATKTRFLLKGVSEKQIKVWIVSRKN